MVVMKETQGAAELLVKLDYLIAQCRAGALHNIVVLSDVEGDGHRMNLLLCMDDAHACAFLDRSIVALKDMLQKEFAQVADSDVH